MYKSTPHRNTASRRTRLEPDTAGLPGATCPASPSPGSSSSFELRVQILIPTLRVLSRTAARSDINHQACADRLELCELRHGTPSNTSGYPQEQGGLPLASRHAARTAGVPHRAASGSVFLFGSTCVLIIWPCGARPGMVSRLHWQACTSQARRVLAHVRPGCRVFVAVSVAHAARCLLSLWLWHAMGIVEACWA